MKSIKNQGRLLGLLFLASAAAGATGTSLRGLTDPSDTAVFLSNLVENAGQMELAISLDLMASAIAMGIAIFLFPLLTKYNRSLGAAYLTIAGISFVVITVSNIIHVALLSMGRDFAESGGLADHFATLSKMGYEAYYWTHFLMLMLYSIGGSILYYLLLRARLIPTWLAIWGLLASVVVFFGGGLQMADISVPFFLFVQNGIFILVFILWLIGMGFRANSSGQGPVPD